MNRHSSSTANKVLPATARGQRTREVLIRAAEHVFGEKGYERASIADITRRAKVALGTFYVYFDGKKTLFLELVDTLSAGLRGTLAKSIAGVPNRLDVERVALETFLGFVREHRHLYRIVRQAEFVDVKAHRRYYQRIAAGYAEGLSAAMKAGEVRTVDPEVLAYCLMGINDMLGMRWVLWERQADLNVIVNDATRFIRDGLHVQTPRRKHK